MTPQRRRDDDATPPRRPTTTQRRRGAWSSLALDGPRATTVAGWLAQARQFYGVARENAAIQDKLALYGVSEAVLKLGSAEVEAVADAGAQQLRERGSAQAATEAREAAMSALHAWMRDFTTIARVALHAQPQQLEKLGLVTRA